MRGWLDYSKPIPGRRLRIGKSKNGPNFREQQRRDTQSLVYSHEERQRALALAKGEKMARCECRICGEYWNRMDNRYSKRQAATWGAVEYTRSVEAQYNKLVRSWQTLAGDTIKSSITATPIVYDTILTNATSTTVTINGSWWGDQFWSEQDMMPQSLRNLILEYKTLPAELAALLGRNEAVELLKNNIYLMPDKSVMRIDALGNYTIRDEFAQVTYQANRSRTFNPFVNASDKIADFIRYVGGLKLGLRGEQVAKLPLGLFVNWLIIEAAERDKDPVPAGVTPVAKNRLLSEVALPRCPWDARFLPRDGKYPYCNPRCAEKHYQKVRAVAA